MKAVPVEDCRSLDLNELLRRRLLTPGHSRAGSLRWTQATTGKEVGSVGYLVEWEEERAVLTFRYGVTRGGEREEVDEPVRLVTSRPPLGGLRWWFVCPLVVNGTPCRKRVSKLYLPPGGKLFGCRSCYRLTYRSVQEHNGRVAALLKDPDGLFQAVEAFLKSPGEGRFPASAFSALFSKRGGL